MTDYPFQHEGACECGGVKFSYHSHTALEELSVRACQCDYCLPRDTRYLSEPAGALRVTVHDRRILYAHQFGTRSADFMHCALCNNLVYVCCRIDEQVYALVVANALARQTGLGAATSVDYDSELLDERLGRRKDRWIGDFELLERRRDV